jgi:hypothetical protein
MTAAGSSSPSSAMALAAPAAATASALGSIVAAIAEAHGAWLQAHARPGGGLGVQVGFPQPQRAAAAAR